MEMGSVRSEKTPHHHPVAQVPQRRRDGFVAKRGIGRDRQKATRLAVQFGGLCFSTKLTVAVSVSRRVSLFRGHPYSPVMHDTEFVFVYSTFPDRQSAGDVAEALVREKLAACVNISALMTSVYEWQGQIQSEPEIAVWIKTRRSLVDAVIAAARRLHPYEVPCFLTLPIDTGNEDYLAWARSQTNVTKTIVTK